jgi:hypothetical protein
MLKFAYKMELFFKIFLQLTRDCNLFEYYYFL